jgi:sulfoxide reductase heme-binding subunit YedZ
MAGMAAFSILAVLAATSTRSAMKRLGRRWVTLHRLVYAAGGLALLHHFWLVKADYRPPSIHAAVLAVLLGTRIVLHLRRRTPEPA